MKKLLLIIFLGSFLIQSKAQTQIGGTINGSNFNDDFARAISLNANGDLIAISAPGNSTSCVGCGSIQLYENVNGSWISKGSPLYGDTALDAMGMDIKLNNTGNTMVVGLSHSYKYPPNRGYVQVYYFNGSQWQQKGNDIVGGIISLAGSSVDISADGNTIAFGEPEYNKSSISDEGRVRVFEWLSGQWVQKGFAIEGDIPDDHAGLSLALSADGNSIAVGYPSSNQGGINFRGKVKVFDWNGAAWVLKGQTFLGPFSGSVYGSAIDLNHDGTILAFSDNYIQGNEVQIWQWNSASTNWSLLGAPIVHQQSTDKWGHKVSLSYNGTVMVSSAIHSHAGTNFGGQLRVFEFASGSWHQRGTDIDGNIAAGYLGRSLAIDSSGKTIAAGSNQVSNSPGYCNVYDASTLVSTHEVDNSKLVFATLGLAPNPFKNFTRLQLNATEQINIQVYNLQGKLILEQTCKGQSHYPLDLSQEENGIYLIRVSDEKGNSKTVKAVKQ